MIILDSVDKSLEIVLGGVPTTQLPIYAAYVDVLTADQSVAAYGANDTQTNSATAVAAASAPLAGRTRTVKFLTVRNSDVASVVCTVRLNNAGTFRILWSGTLEIGDTLQYED